MRTAPIRAVNERSAEMNHVHVGVERNIRIVVEEVNKVNRNDLDAFILPVSLIVTI